MIPAPIGEFIIYFGAGVLAGTLATIFIIKRNYDCLMKVMVHGTQRADSEGCAGHGSADNNVGDDHEQKRDRKAA